MSTKKKKYKENVKNKMRRKKDKLKIQINLPQSNF